MRWTAVIGLVVSAGLFAVLPALPAAAQAPVYQAPPPGVGAPPPGAPLPPAEAAPPSEAAAIARCLCQHRDLDAASADMAAKRRAYDDVQAELARADAQLAQQRGTIDVNNPAAVAQFSQALQQRDALFRRSTGPAASDLSAAVARYNAVVNQYNTECANRPRDPVLLAQVQAALRCPAP